MSDFNDWFKSLPQFTKWWLTLTLSFSLLGRFGILRPEHLILWYEALKNFQVSVTCYNLFTDCESG